MDRNLSHNSSEKDGATVKIFIFVRNSRKNVKATALAEILSDFPLNYYTALV